MTGYVRPEIVEKPNKEWVLNGKNNSFYQYIIDRYKGSATNSSIIQSYITLIYGKGLGATNQRSNLNDWARLKSILKPNELRKIITDFVIFGEASFQTIRTKGKDLHSIVHFPKQNLAPSTVNEDNEIESYWYCKNWSNTFKNTPVEFSAFGTSKDAIEIYNIKPYSVGQVYFSDPEYLPALPYCELEEEIANVNINYAKNSFSFGYIVNIPDGKSLSAEEKDQLEAQIKRKLTSSSNAGTFILSFNGRDAGEITITVVPVASNIHKQWESLIAEAKNQIMTAHRVISPSLVGLSSASGFSSVADEMDMSEKQLVKRVTAPKGAVILDAIEEVLSFYGINLDLYFKPLTEESEQPAEELSSHVCMSDDGASEEMANSLIEFGETLEEDDWLLLSSAEVDYDTDDDLYTLLEFATSTGVARPNAKSLQDNEDIAIRYRYVGNPLPERLFCKKMIFANKLYRKEDILQMNRSGVNDGFGLNGTNSYSIWLWKGGGKMSAAFPNGTCKHKWQREIYLKRGGGVDVNSPLAKTISTNEARRKGYKVPVNDSDVSITPNRNK